MFLGIPDPDPLVIGTDPDPNQNVTDHLFYRYFYVNEGYFLANHVYFLNFQMPSFIEISSEEGSRVGSGSISQRCGSGSEPKCHGSPTLIYRYFYVKRRVFFGKSCVFLKFSNAIFDRIFLLRRVL
jgi:hypothetical protein